MKIYTKKGDKGKTSLFGGERVSKSHIRIESYGMTDELNSYLGLIRDSSGVEKRNKEVISIQNDLFSIGSHLATTNPKSVSFLPELDHDKIKDLETWIDLIEKDLPELKAFILPGGHVTVSHSHVARCVCRRAERKVVELAIMDQVNPFIITYLNRLSDYLFTLARFYSNHFNIKEVKWEPRK